MDNRKVFSFKRIVKKARSGFILLSRDIAIIPEMPIKKTIGIIIKKEIQRLCFNIFSFLAEKTLCQLPWWKRFVAATAMKKVNPDV